MIVYAFTGPSGTGKSHHAPFYAYNNNIQVIIDDGLLIKNNQAIAGISAKRERTRFGAVKRAIFKDPEHAETVKEKISELKPEKIMIIATSKRMSQRIAQRLELPYPQHYININDFIPEENIQKALEIREKQNQHVIPLPTFAIKKDFPGYLIAPLRSFYTRAATDHKNVPLERTIMRPIYSSMGDFFINENVIKQLCQHISETIPGVHQCNKTQTYSDDSGVTVELQLTMIYGHDLKNLLIITQKEVKEKIEHLTGFYLKNVYVIAKHLHVPEHRKPPSLAGKHQEEAPDASTGIIVNAKKTGAENR